LPLDPAIIHVVPGMDRRLQHVEYIVAILSDDDQNGVTAPPRNASHGHEKGVRRPAARNEATLLFQRQILAIPTGRRIGPVFATAMKNIVVNEGETPVHSRVHFVQFLPTFRGKPDEAAACWGLST
jgi:hypothetical protein